MKQELLCLYYLGKETEVQKSSNNCYRVTELGKIFEQSSPLSGNVITELGCPRESNENKV